MTRCGVALMAEVVSVLAGHQTLRVTPEVATDEKADGLVTLTLTVHPTSTSESLEALSLLDELQGLLDMVQVRELAMRYDLSPDDLDPLLRRIYGEPRRVVTAGASEPAADATQELRARER